LLIEVVIKLIIYLPKKVLLFYDVHKDIYFENPKQMFSVILMVSLYKRTFNFAFRWVNFCLDFSLLSIYSIQGCLSSFSKYSSSSLSGLSFVIIIRCFHHSHCQVFISLSLLCVCVISEVRNSCIRHHSVVFII